MVRSARHTDFDAIDAFDELGGDRRTEIGAGRMLVVEFDCAVAGYVSWHPAGFNGRPFITFLCVARPFRRAGLAARLLQAANETIGTGRRFISTEAGNLAMHLLLKRDGWIAAGEIAGANEDGGAEAFFYIDRR